MAGSNENTVVNLDDFESAIGAIPAAIAEVKEAMDAAIAASARFEDAFGGDATDIGNLVSANVSEIDKASFATTEGEINKHLETMIKFDNTYREQKGLIKKAINDYVATTTEQ